MSSADNILFHRIADPDCGVVRKAINENPIRAVTDYRNVDTSDQALKDLRQILNGRDEVPCLVVQGRPLVGKIAILDWLKKL